MTGYGKAEAQLESGKITIELRTLNGKTADISIKSQLLPKDKELLVRQKIADKLHRVSSQSRPMQYLPQSISTRASPKNITDRSAHCQKSSGSMQTPRCS